MEKLMVLRRRRAFSLLEINLTLAVVVICVGAYMYGAQRQQTEAHDAYLAIQSQVSAARELAKTTGNGATLVIVPNASSFTSAVYSGRPTGGTFSTTAIDPATGNVALSSNVAGSEPLALFFSASSTVSATSWNIGDATIGTEPTCSAATTITITVGSQTVSGSIQCNDPRFI